MSESEIDQLRKDVDDWIGRDENACRTGALPVSGGQADYASEGRPGYVRSWGVISKLPALFARLAEKDRELAALREAADRVCIQYHDGYPESDAFAAAINDLSAAAAPEGKG